VSRSRRLTLDAPVAGLLEVTGLTPTELATKLDVTRTAVTAARAAGNAVQLSTLERYALAAGGIIEIRFVPRKP
jgi:hypothetical protein